MSNKSSIDDIKLEDIKLALDELKISNSKIISSVNNTSNGQNKLNKKFDDMLKTILEDNKILKEKVNTLEKKVALLESNFSISHSSKENDLVEEILDRQLRSCNLIMFNLPEVIENENNTENDFNRISNIFKQMETNISKFTFTRLGKDISSNPEKPRPIKIILSNTLEVYSSLRLQANLRKSTIWSNIRISSDRTNIQREQMNKLRQELQKRKDDGENNIIIKYFKGTPKIVTIQKKF